MGGEGDDGWGWGGDVCSGGGCVSSSFSFCLLGGLILGFEGARGGWGVEGEERKGRVREGGP